MKSYITLKKEFQNSTFIPYEELLKTSEWAALRDLILERDLNTCTKCQRKATSNGYIKDTGALYIWYGVETKFQFTNSFGQLVKDTYVPMEFSDKPYCLQIHHKFYVLDKLPWEYVDDAFITLCNWCHWEFHENNRVPVFESEDRINDMNYNPCIRCNGTGSFPEYKHVENGVCFRCRGARFEELIKNETL